MKSLKLLSAPVGAFVLVTALATYLVAPGRSTWVAVQVGVGLVLVLLGTLLNLTEIAGRLRGRAVREGTGDVAYIIIVGLVLALVNFLAVRHHGRKDLTEQGEFSLSEQTRQILASLPREVEATGYYYADSAAEQEIEDLLKEYEYQGRPKFHFKLIDPIKNPAQAKVDEVTSAESVVLRSGGSSDILVSPDEEKMTNALLKVTRDERTRICFAIGHGEKDIQEEGPQGLTSFKTASERQQTEFTTFSPAMGVPENCAAVVVAGPDKPYLPPEAERLKRYLDGGGRAALLLDPGVDSGLEPLLSEYGISLRQDVIIDRVSALFGGQPDIPMVPADGYDSHPITKGFQYQTFYPLATSLALASPPPEGVDLRPLASTTSLSWGESHYETEAPTGKLRLGPEDLQGPLVVAAAAVREGRASENATEEGARESSRTEDSARDPLAGEAEEAEGTAPAGERITEIETRVVVFGDSDFPSNAYFNATSNGEFMLNVTNWLTGQEELVALRPKSPIPRLVNLTQQQANLILFFSLLVTPVAILTTGGAIWLRRRRL